MDEYGIKDINIIEKVNDAPLKAEKDKTVEKILKDNEDVTKIKQIIDLDKNGKLDEIANHYFNEKNKKLLSLKDCILSIIQTKDIKDEAVSKELLKKIEEYKDIFNKKNELVEKKE